MTDTSDVVVTTVDEVLFRDGQALVLVGSEVMLLSAMASEIVAACVQATSVADLGQHLIATFGPPPPDTTVATQTASLVRHLAEAGVVSLTRAPAS